MDLVADGGALLMVPSRLTAVMMEVEPSSPVSIEDLASAGVPLVLQPDGRARIVGLELLDQRHIRWNRYCRGLVPHAETGSRQDTVAPAIP